MQSYADLCKEQRFWAFVDADGDCWEWMGILEKRSGYGRWNVPRGKTWMAHRFAYTLLVGPIPDGKHVDHLCRNRACVNPDHLEPVDPGENVRRGYAGARNAAKTHCPKGHPYDEENTYRNGNKRVCRTCGLDATNLRNRIKREENAQARREAHLRASELISRCQAAIEASIGGVATLPRADASALLAIAREAVSKQSGSAATR